MKLEVLIATMNQKNNNLIEKMNIKSDAIIINQSDKFDYEEINLDNKFTIRKFTNMQKGLSRSRNEAILNAKADICLIADDDIRYKDNYNEIVIKAFEELPDADIIVFNTTMINCEGLVKRKDFKKIRKAPKYKNYGSVRIAFKTKSLLKNNIWFNVLFGAGAKIKSGEESLMFREANRKGLKIYEYPENIADVDYSVSSWFDGYNEKFFQDKGTFLVFAYPKLKNILKYYYIFKFLRLGELSIFSIIKNINKGIKNY